MAITISIRSSAASSNKTEAESTIDLGYKKMAYGYTYKIGVHKGKLVVVTKPFIDKIAVTHHIESLAVRDFIAKMLADLAAAGLGKPMPYSKTGFKFNLAYPIEGTDEQVLCSIDPKKKTSMRLEFNPSKLGRKGMKQVRALLPDLSDNQITYKSFMATGNVTRVDIAADIVNVPIERLLVENVAGTKSLAFYGITGKIESMYLGKVGSSQAKLKLYDKLQEVLDHKGTPPYGNVPHTRIEITVTHPKKTVAGLATLANQFLKLSVILPDVVAPLPVSEHCWQHFLDSCRFRGSGMALAFIPAKDRKIYKAALLNAASTFWNPAQIWKYWPNALKASGLLG